MTRFYEAGEFYFILNTVPTLDVPPPVVVP
jgi:hypothetical protein